MQHIFLGTLSLYEIFAYFFLYSFLGWVAEVAFHAITVGKFVNRGFLNGPVCPVYGVGVVVILLILGPYVEKAWLVFLVGIALPTLIELATGWALETFFHNKWWDYSSRKFNFKGYICLEFSLLWGLAVLFVVEVVHPGIRWLAGLCGEVLGTVLVTLCLAALVADCVVTVLQVLKLNRKLKEIDKLAEKMRLGSDLIGEKISDVTITAEKKVLRAKEKIDEKVDSIVSRMPQRLLKAFPHLTSKRNSSSLPLAKESMERLKKKEKGTRATIREERTAEKEEK